MHKSINLAAVIVLLGCTHVASHQTLPTRTEAIARCENNSRYDTILEGVSKAAPFGIEEAKFLKEPQAPLPKDIIINRVWTGPHIHKGTKVLSCQDSKVSNLEEDGWVTILFRPDNP